MTCLRELLALCTVTSFNLRHTLSVQRNGSQSVVTASPKRYTFVRGIKSLSVMFFFLAEVAHYPTCRKTSGRGGVLEN